MNIHFNEKDDYLKAELVATENNWLSLAGCDWQVFVEKFMRLEENDISFLKLDAIPKVTEYQVSTFEIVKRDDAT